MVDLEHHVTGTGTEEVHNQRNNAGHTESVKTKKSSKGTSTGGEVIGHGNPASYNAPQNQVQQGMSEFNKQPETKDNLSASSKADVMKSNT